MFTKYGALPGLTGRVISISPERIPAMSAHRTGLVFDSPGITSLVGLDYPAHQTIPGWRWHHGADAADTRPRSHRRRTGRVPHTRIHRGSACACTWWANERPVGRDRERYAAQFRLF